VTTTETAAPLTVDRKAELSMGDRYAGAAALAPAHLLGLMRNRSIVPTWTGKGDEFWYQRQTDTDAAQHEFVLVEPNTGEVRVAPTLELLGVEPPSAAAVPAGVLRSPDGTRGLLIREHDLWLLDLATGAERRLTDSGEAGFGWGELPENNLMSVPFRRMGVVLPPMGTVFSPSGRKVLTMRHDQRSMGTRHLVEHVGAHGARPECHEYRDHLDGEGVPPPPEARLIDLESGHHAPVDVSDGLLAGLSSIGSDLVTWSKDETKLYLLNHAMGASSAALVEIDASTGARRDVLRVSDPPLYEPNQFMYSLPLVRVLPDSGELVLFSQRDGWGHLYLYDLTTGERRYAITSGELVVRDILRVDTERREITFLAGWGTGGHNPLWRKVFRASLDGGQQRLLTHEPADHDLPAPQPQYMDLIFGQGKAPVDALSPSGRFFVDHQSTVSESPVILLRDAHADGQVVRELERTDVSRLIATGYVAPQAFCVKADDDVTDLWGVISLPQAPIDPHRIPVVDHIYAGFQTTWAPMSFLGGGGMSGAHAAFPSYNELGFATVILDGRGTPGRHRTFRQWTHRHGGTSRGIEDHVTAIFRLAETYPQLDLSGVGVVGHSFGGYNAARSMLMFPEFFTVGISSAGVNDPRKATYDAWAWFLGDGYDRDSEEYRALGNLHLAEKLAGKLLIACGEIDENATVDHSYALAEALMRAGKRFDMNVWPGVNHYSQPPYAHMVFWDHFVTHLLGVEPPSEFVPS